MSSRSVDSASTRLGAAASPDGDRQLMSKEHKDLLRKHRVDIIENMYPDDVLTFLQTRAIFTPKDVSRVKEKGGVDNQNEHLLDILLRKPDKGFRAFLDALKRSEQDHVAELLDSESDSRKNPPGATGSGGGTATRGAKSKRGSAGASNYSQSDDEYLSPPSTPRKRKAQTVNVRANVSGVEHEEVADDESEEEEEEDVLAPQSKRRNRRVTLAPQPETRDEALVAKLNEELLEAYILETRNLKDVLRSGVTQQTIQARKAIMETLSFLNKQRRELRGIYEGSVIFCVYCPTLQALEDLWLNYQRRTLQRLFDKIFVKDKLGLRQKYKLKSITVEVTISVSDYEICKEEILSKNEKEDSLPAHCEEKEHKEKEEEVEREGPLLSWCKEEGGFQPHETAASRCLRRQNSDKENSKKSQDETQRSSKKASSLGSERTPFTERDIEECPETYCPKSGLSGIHDSKEAKPMANLCTSEWHGSSSTLAAFGKTNSGATVQEVHDYPPSMDASMIGTESTSVTCDDMLPSVSGSRRLTSEPGASQVTHGCSPPSSGFYSATGSFSGDSWHSDVRSPSPCLWDEDLSVGSLNLSLS